MVVHPRQFKTVHKQNSIAMFAKRVSANSGGCRVGFTNVTHYPLSQMLSIQHDI